MQQIPDRRIITYGFDKESDVQVSKITATETGSCFDVILRDRGKRTAEVLSGSNFQCTANIMF